MATNTKWNCFSYTKFQYYYYTKGINPEHRPKSPIKTRSFYTTTKNSLINTQNSKSIEKTLLNIYNDLLKKSLIEKKSNFLLYQNALIETAEFFAS